VAIEGEPVAIDAMRRDIEEADRRLIGVESAIKMLGAQYADELIERMRLVRAMDQASLKAERGELDAVDLDPVKSAAAGSTILARSHWPEKPRMDDLLGDQVLGNIADEAFRMRQAGSSIDEIAEWIAWAVPRETLLTEAEASADPVAAARRIVEGVFGDLERQQGDPGS